MVLAWNVTAGTRIQTGLMLRVPIGQQRTSSQRHGRPGKRPAPIESNHWDPVLQQEVRCIRCMDSSGPSIPELDSNYNAGQINPHQARDPWVIFSDQLYLSKELNDFAPIGDHLINQ